MTLVVGVPTNSSCEFVGWRRRIKRFISRPEVDVMASNLTPGGAEGQ